jgi:O-antigen/teichoic acid export membrane protein
MGIADGFTFWLGKALAELAIVAIIIGGFLLFGVVIVLYDHFQRRKWRRERARKAKEKI